MNATVDPDLIKAVQQHAIALKNDVAKLAFEKEELRKLCQSVILNIITALEELEKRVSSLELEQSEQRSRQEDVERRVTYLEGQSSIQICPGNVSVSFYLSLLKNTFSLHVLEFIAEQIYFDNRSFSLYLPLMHSYFFFFVCEPQRVLMSYISRLKTLPKIPL